MIRSLKTLAALIVLQAMASAQASPESASLESLKREAAARSSEWSALAGTMEAHVGKMLPCDVRVRASIEEVSKSSEARLAADLAYWHAAEAKSHERLEALQSLASLQQTRAAEWTRDEADASQEQTSVEAHVVALKGNLEKVPALAGPEKELEAIAGATQTLAEQTAQRSMKAAGFADDILQSATAERALHASLESEVKALTAESAAWNEYYAARLARAKTECSITGAAGESTTSPAASPTTGRRTVRKKAAK